VAHPRVNPLFGPRIENKFKSGYGERAEAASCYFFIASQEMSAEILFILGYRLAKFSACQGYLHAMSWAPKVDLHLPQRKENTHNLTGYMVSANYFLLSICFMNKI
jgi:hypothetical protein